MVGTIHGEPFGVRGLLENESLQLTSGTETEVKAEDCKIRSAAPATLGVPALFAVRVSPAATQMQCFEIVLAVVSCLNRSGCCVRPKGRMWWSHSAQRDCFLPCDRV
jgi:hypothetical protein